jgi:hypothetical protein
MATIQGKDEPIRVDGEAHMKHMVTELKGMNKIVMIHMDIGGHPPIPIGSSL